MTRADVLKLFPDATDEQVTNLLNSYNADISKEKAKTEKIKNDASEVEELRRKLDEINQQNMTDIEKANAERDKALNSVSDLQAEIKRMQLRTQLAEKGIIGDSADKLLDSLSSGTFDVEVLGQIISDREKNAVSAFEKEKLNSTPSANELGGQKNGGADNKPDDVKNAESISFGVNFDSNAVQSARDYYK